MESAGDGEHRTEIDGLRAVWRPTHDIGREIEVMAVHDTGENPVIDVTFAPDTDLADAREHRPNWNRLWDKVRREFWTECTLPTGARSEGAQPDPGSYMQWAIVTTVGSCGNHDGPCPTGVWGPYNSLTEAESAATCMSAGHSPHIVPHWPRRYQR
ncbi:hypothetical protein [Nocardia sp. BMG51109]|uniref:hypothetical protein n=1 Tax=Nocardia sp. BMG51109 TaxID=1056816 RepID=UPI0004669026|nr:hypothetical protein [Nocardia sp. BMG51109]